jgi:hypothetical protein
MKSAPYADSKFQIPRINQISDTTQRPLWSVMIPTFNCAGYLRQTLQSVLAQDAGPDQMQIEVVDDCSTKDDPQAVVQELGHGRVSFYRLPQNEGAVQNFNTCIERSLGHYVHILHGDDWVAPGYYQTIAELARCHPNLGLYATRSFFVNEDSVITAVSPRLPTLEQPSKSATPFYYDCPLEFPGVTVRRTAYEALGGFRPALLHTADRETWARVVAGQGGIVSSEVMGFYRVSASSHTSRMVGTAENVRDMCRVHTIFADCYPDFSATRAKSLAAELAWNQYRQFDLSGDKVAASENWRMWRELTPILRQTAQRVVTAVRPAIGKIVFGDRM